MIFVITIKAIGNKKKVLPNILVINFTKILFYHMLISSINESNTKITNFIIEGIHLKFFKYCYLNKN